jgi:hypothetical protein
MKGITKFIIFILFLLIPYSIFNIQAVYAQNEFTVDSSVTYQVDEKGIIHTSHQITLFNNLPTVYAKSYNFTLENIEPKNLKAYQDNQNLDLAVSKDKQKISIEINFPDSVVGKDAKRTFYISYDIDNLAEKTGEVWEISVPKLSDPNDFRNYQAVLIVPRTFGNPAYISPQPTQTTNDQLNYRYLFAKDTIAKAGVTASFGEFQLLSFTINYHLENPLSRDSDVQIALPPDTSFQKIYYNTINPKPKSVASDEDGNWIATYSLGSRQRLDVLTSGSVQIFASPRFINNFSDDVLQKETLPQTYWESNDPQITKIASGLKNVEQIYNYVVNTLSYDYERVRPNVQRLGAKQALDSPKSAICMEFTDLFVALARAKGIPAREVNGYAYTENTSIKPLSLVADVLHSWPEYWDANKKIWIAVDPTWQNTTGGVDYFNKFDLRHFVFVIHGIDSSKPYAPGSYKLGANPQKDVFVNLGSEPDLLSKKKLSIEAFLTSKIPFISHRLNIKITNSGPSALYDQPVIVYFDNNKFDSKTIDRLLPFDQYGYSLDIPFSFFGRNSPSSIMVSFDDEQTTLPGVKNDILLSNLIIVFLLGFLIFLLTLIKLQKINLGLIKELFVKLNTSIEHVFKKNKDINS